MAAFSRFLIKFAKFKKTMEKPRFSYGFSMISRVRRVSKLMKNMKKLSPECFGAPKNSAGWAGLARLAAQVANMGQMGGQWTALGSDYHLQPQKNGAGQGHLRAFLRILLRVFQD